MASGGEWSLSQREGRARRETRAGEVEPLYKRLPHGPHSLEREQVVLHQRARIHGAMVEAIASDGFQRTSVKQVIGLAGVSRRSFYEQFANKQECFLATFDMLAHREVARVQRAYLSSSGPIEERLGAAFECFAQSTREDPKAMRLLFVEAQSVGEQGTVRLRQASAACEQMLSHSFVRSAGASPLPTPIVRAITGGLHASIARLLAAPTQEQLPDLAGEMLDWTLIFQTSAAAPMAEVIGARTAREVRRLSIAAAAGRQTRGARPSGDARQRLMTSALRLAGMNDYSELTAPQIADEAHVGVDEFFDEFGDRDDCFLAALEMAGSELVAIAAGFRNGEDWPRAVRRRVGDLMRHLAARPLHARALTQDAFCAGQAASERSLELARTLATLLTDGAPAPASSQFTVEGIAGALWHTIRCQVAGGRVPLLAALGDYLSYIVLAPYIGADAAIHTVAGDPPD
jgi:AcrR family transcriptional regulator